MDNGNEAKEKERFGNGSRKKKKERQGSKKNPYNYKLIDFAFKAAKKGLLIIHFFPVFHAPG